MEKLIELLNEYACGENKELYWRDVEMIDLNSERVISKKFGFIKWLVDNDKIDKEKFNYCRDNFFDERYFGYGTHEYIIMMLAIQDSPLEFLISILK